MKKTPHLLNFTAAVLGFACVSISGFAADHADSPTVGGDQGADLADVYAFLDPVDNTKLILINTIRGFIVPGEAGNFALFDEDVRYTFQIENTGDSTPDLFIDVTFNQRLVPVIDKKGLSVADAGFVAPTITGFKNVPRTQQDAIVSFRGKVPTSLAGVKGKSYAPVTQPTLAGTATTDGAPPAELINNLKNAAGTDLGIKFFAGEQDDPFFFDIPGFIRFANSVTAGTPVPGHLDRGRDTFAGYNVMTIAMSVPVSLLKSTKTPINTLGISCVAARKTERSVKGNKVGGGAFTTVDREGIPGVNAVFIPYNRKNEYNGITTRDDGKGVFFNAIAARLTSLGTNGTNIGILASVVGLPVPTDFDSVKNKLKKGAPAGKGDMLRLDTTLANDGVGGAGSNGNGFPNGRRPGDDVIDTILDYVVNQNAAINSDNVDANDLPFRATFPYLAAPHMPRGNVTLDDNTRN
jgi:hypothetical protein